MSVTELFVYCEFSVPVRYRAVCVLRVLCVCPLQSCLCIASSLRLSVTELFVYCEFSVSVRYIAVCVL